MSDADRDELERLSDGFTIRPLGLTIQQLNRLDTLLTRLADDPEVPEARRLASALMRAAVAYWRIKSCRGVPPEPPA